MDVDFLAHVCFRFKSPDGHILLTDPMYADSFPWEGHVERYLSPPDVPVEDIERCDAIFISHAHGDHCDPKAVLAIQNGTGAKVVAPADVLELLQAQGADPAHMHEAEEGARYGFGDLNLVTCCGYDESVDEAGRPNKFSCVIECGPTRLFYSGDCHELPTSVLGTRVDAMFMWPHPDDAVLQGLCADIESEHFVLMHCDRFEPGDFFCNMDLEEQRLRVSRLLPGTNKRTAVRR
jgi:L-ascorbate metabolism protein UlaG (beta-lactamase superfamily)